MGYLLMNQRQRLLEIQEIQVNLMEELARKSPRRRQNLMSIRGDG
jgi:hypothetical protein